MSRPRDVEQGESGQRSVSVDGRRSNDGRNEGLASPDLMDDDRYARDDMAAYGSDSIDDDTKTRSSACFESTEEGQSTMEKELFERLSRADTDDEKDFERSRGRPKARQSASAKRATFRRRLALERSKHFSHSATFHSLHRTQPRIPNVAEEGFLQERRRQLEHTHSFDSRVPVEPSVRMPVEFRTLSLHVEETIEHKTKAVEDKKKKKKAKDIKDVADLDFHRLPADELLRRLGVSPHTGLDPEQVKRRMDRDGKNVISPPPKRWLRKIVGWIFGGFGTLLLGASVICFLAWKPLGGPSPQPSNLALAVVLLIVVLLQTFFNAYQSWSTSKVMSSISGILPSTVIARRAGVQTAVPSAQLVVGDIVHIAMGAKIPADLRLIECSNDLRFDRAVLTGESEPVPGTVDVTDDNFLETKNIALQASMRGRELGGTHCVSGAGVGVVVLTGDSTLFGRIAKMAAQEHGHRTTLEKEILRFVLIITSMAVTVALLVLILWAAWLRVDHPGYLSVSAMLVDLVSVLVAFIPEGLPIAVTLSLTVIANAMRKNKVLCKSLSTVETLGSVNVLCSDKTGTLTQNKMLVEGAAILDQTFTVAGLRDQVREGGLCSQAVRQLHTVAAVCNAARFDSSTDDGPPLAKRKILGDATDSAILRMAEEVESVSEVIGKWDKVFELPFNSKNKFMLKLAAPAVRDADVGDDSRSDGLILFAKGAPDVLLPRCSSALTADGTVTGLDETVSSAIVGLQEEWAGSGRRVLLLAKKHVRDDEIAYARDSGENALAEAVMELNFGLTVVGLVAIVDPPRPEIPRVIATCRRAGVRFNMVTGDFALTAVAIARQCGIVTASKVSTAADLDPNEPVDQVDRYDPYADNDAREERALAVLGSELATFNENQWDQVCNYDAVVFSRTTPEQKLRIVKEFQARGGVVGMTGDGVNDAPSLKQADVGVAMGGGSEVTMEASDMVLLENFGSIVVALEYGRLCFDNLKKTILYLLPAGSFAELWCVLISVFFGVPQAMSNLQMIIVCVGTDLFPSLSLIKEKPEADLLTRRPRNVKKDRLADWKLLVHAYIFVGVPMTLCSMAMVFWYLQRQGIPFSDMWLKFGGGHVQTVDPTYFNDKVNEAQSIYFFNLVVMQWFNLLALRTRRLSIFQQPPIGKRSSRNVFLFGAMAIAFCIAVFFCYVPFFQKTFLTSRIPVENFFLPMAFGTCLLFLDEVRKFLVRRYPKGPLAKAAW